MMLELILEHGQEKVGVALGQGVEGGRVALVVVHQRAEVQTRRRVHYLPGNLDPLRGHLGPAREMVPGGLVPRQAAAGAEQLGTGLQDEGGLLPSSVVEGAGQEGGASCLKQPLDQLRQGEAGRPGVGQDAVPAEVPDAGIGGSLLNKDLDQGFVFS